MSLLTIDDFVSCIKKERKKYFDSPFKFVYDIFCEQKYNEKNSEYFLENASSFITEMRSYCWEKFKPIENDFTTKMLSYLIDENKITNMSPIEAIKDFTTTYPMHIYNLSLSNTQSRRSRAGKEFEAILMLLLLGADIPADSQGSIGKSFFQKNQIGKLVDFVSPGVVHYLIDKRDTFLISAKTTLRERWQEVPEEVTRTGIREMYLTTLDDSFSSETLRILYEANIYIVTTKEIKEKKYSSNNSVITFEEMLKSAKEICLKWDTKNLSEKELIDLKVNIHNQVNKYNSFPYIMNYYSERLSILTK